MRSDIDTNTDYESSKGARTESEVVDNSSCFGINVLKAAKYINLMAGTSLSIVCGFSIFNIFSLSANPLSALGVILLDFYEW